jgi:hypothetical protein
MAASEPVRPERPRPPALALLGLITLAGLALRLPSFGDSLFGDELSAYYVVAGHGLHEVMHLLDYHSTELNPQLFFMLTWAATKVFGLSSESMKLVSLVVGTLTIPMIYALGRQAAGVRTGLVAAALAALSPFLIYYSTEARPYALMLFLVTGAVLALLRAVRTGGWGWFLLYALCTCAAAYTHFTAIFALAAIALWGLITQPRARWKILAADALAAVAYIPELPVLHRISRSPGTSLYQYLDPLTAHSAVRDLSRWAIGHPYEGLAQIPGTAAVVLIAAGLVLGLVAGAGAVAAASRDGVRPRPPAIAALVVVLALAAPVGAALYSLLKESVWGSRNVISSWGGSAVTLAAIVVSPRRPLNLGATALLVAGFAVGGVSMLSSSVHRPDYNGAVAYINRLDPRGGPIADFPAPSPGPPDETEAALALAGVARQHPVYRIGSPPLKAVIAAPPYAPLPVPQGETIAREVSAAAGRGPLFFVLPAAEPPGWLAAIRRQHVHSTDGALGYLGSFLGALPDRFRLITSRRFPGLVPVTVYVLRG